MLSTLPELPVKKFGNRIKMRPPRWPDGKEYASQCRRGDAGDVGSIPESGRSPGVRNGNPHEYSCLESPRDRGSWREIVHGSQSVGH